MAAHAKEFSGNEITDAIALAVSHFNLPQEKLKIEVLDTGSTGIFGFRRKKAKIRVTPHTATAKKPATATAQKKAVSTPQPASAPVSTTDEQNVRQQQVPASVVVSDEMLAVIQQEAETLLKYMDISAVVVTLTRDDDAIKVHISSDNDELLIGPEGKTLDSFQYLLRKIISRMLGEKLALHVDIGEYRQQRTDELIALSRELAVQAIKEGKAQSISSLNPQERRVVHMAIRDNKEIRTKSIGSGLFKKILIFPHDQKPPAKPRRGRPGGRRNQKS